MKKSITIIFATFVVLFMAFTLHAGVVTTLTLIEKDGVTTNNYPLTFGHVFKEGDIPAGIVVKYNDTALTTQFDIKTSWPGGSIKFGVISVVIPQVVANGAGVLTIETAVSNNSAGMLDKTAILDTNVESNINLSNLSESGYSGSVSSSLRDQITSGDLQYWLKGPVCTEILEKQQLNTSLNTAWEARFYPGTSFGIRISNSIENVNIQAMGNVHYDVSIQHGESTPATVYTKTGFNHLYGSRWRKVFWLGAEPPETELHYDIPYLISTGAIANYDTSITIPEDSISSMYTSWNNASKKDIDGNGLLQKFFPQTGGRSEIGILPKWSALYLFSMDNRMKEVVIAHSEIAGHVPQIHWRETDATKSNYDSVITIDDRPTLSLFNKAGGTVIGTLDNGGWTPDRSHHGSFSYLAYLITGEYWHHQETMFWGSFVLAWDIYNRNGAGNSQNFSAGHDYTWGIIYDQERAMAWSLRTLSDVVFVSLDETTSQNNYFSSKLNNNIEWLHLGNRTGKHGVHAIRCPRETQPDNAPGYPANRIIAPWMHDFNVLSIKHIKDQKTADATRVSELLNYLGYFTVGRFTNHPTFNKWDGTGYFWPLSESTPGNYYSEGDWSGYFSQISAANLIKYGSATFPNVDFSRYAYGDSYLAISIAALACLEETPNSQIAYDFARSQMPLSSFEGNPTWAFAAPYQQGKPMGTVLLGQ